METEGITVDTHGQVLQSGCLKTVETTMRGSKDEMLPVLRCSIPQSSGHKSVKIGLDPAFKALFT